MLLQGSGVKAKLREWEKNDTYHVCYDNDRMEDDYHVPGNFIRDKGLKFKKDNIVAVFLPENPNIEERAVVMGVNTTANTYALKFDNPDFGTRPQIPANCVRPYILQVNEVVQVQDENHSSIWRRGQITALHDDGTYDVLHTNESIGTEINVPLKRLRRPMFQVGDKVSAYLDNNWQQAIITNRRQDRFNYDIRLTLTDEARVVPATHLQFQVLEDIMERVRQGKPLRKGNYEEIPEGPGKRPKNQRFKKRRPLSYRELPNNQFDITVDTTEGLGVHLGWTEDQKVIVAGFRDLENGDWGPLEASGLVMLKDQVIKINDVDVTTNGMAEISETILASKQRIKIRFGRESVAPSQVDMEVAQT